MKDRKNRLDTHAHICTLSSLAHDKEVAEILDTMRVRKRDQKKSLRQYYQRMRAVTMTENQVDLMPYLSRFIEMDRVGVEPTTSARCKDNPISF